MTNDELDTFCLQVSNKELKIWTDPAGTLRAGTGATIWDSCLVLLKYFEKTSKAYHPQTIIELGAGTGLLSIGLAELYPDCFVKATDLPSVLPLLSKNVLASGLANITTKELDWTRVDSELEKVDMIVMSDLITWPELYDSLIHVLDVLSSKDTIVIFSHESRSFEKEAHFYAKLSKSFTFHHLKPKELDDQYQSEDIYVFVAKRK